MSGSRQSVYGRASRGVLGVDDRVRWCGGEYRVRALSGAVVSLAPAGQVPAGHEGVQVPLAVLAAAPDFAVLDAAGKPVAHDPLPDWALLEGISPEAAVEARLWQRSIIEVETGLPPDAPDGARPRAGYDLERTTFKDRYRAKAAELSAVLGMQVSWQTVQAKRLKYQRNPTVLALVDGRRLRTRTARGATDPRVVSQLLVLVDRQQRGQSAPSDARRLFKQLRRSVQATYGAEVKVPAESTLYRLLDQLGMGLPHDRVTSELACPAGQVGRMSLCPSLIRKSSAKTLCGSRGTAARV